MFITYTCTFLKNSRITTISHIVECVKSTKLIIENLIYSWKLIISNLTLNMKVEKHTG